VSINADSEQGSNEPGNPSQTPIGRHSADILPDKKPSVETDRHVLIDGVEKKLTPTEIPF